MDSDDVEVAPALRELILQYDKWRRIYALAGEAPMDAPVWEGGRLHLRTGYRYPGWTGYVVDPREGGCSIAAVTSEHRNEPVESLRGVFSAVDDAGKYIVLKIGESLRIGRRLDPVEWTWEDEGLDPRVRQISLDQYVSKFELRDDPTRYFVLQSGGVQPENRLLALSYAELNSLLLGGMPESIVSQL